MNYDELEEKVLESIDSSPKFAQQRDFAEQEVVPSKELIGLGIGGGISGIATGLVQDKLPDAVTSFGIQGLVPIVIGTGLKFILKGRGGMKEDIPNGMIVAGIAQAVAGFTDGMNFAGGNVAQKRDKSNSENTQIVPQGMNAIW
jgi:hypothetical protein